MPNKPGRKPHLLMSMESNASTYSYSLVARRFWPQQT